MPIDRCILLLGGSFDPVHVGHVGLARYFCTLLHPDELRLIPAGRPWQKPGLATPSEHRIAMLELAFADWMVPVYMDTQEIERDGPSYAVDTLRIVRSTVGAMTSLIWVIGADQLLNLHTWHQWRDLFSLANLCIASRPGYGLSRDALDNDVASEIVRRQADPGQLRASASGLCFIAPQLALEVSSTALRAALTHGQSQIDPRGMLPRRVLDYIQHYHLYQTD